MKADVGMNSYSNFRAIITSVNGNTYNISPNVTSFDIYESIQSYLIYGDMVIMDDSGLIHKAPLMGQETIEIQFTKDEKDNVLFFNVVNISDIREIKKNVVSIKFDLISNKEMIDSSVTFSKSYSTSISNIISWIHKDYLHEEIEIIDDSINAINIVFPYMKPYKAIYKLLQYSYSKEWSPLFLFETLNKVGTPTLISMKSMLEAESKVTITKKPTESVDIDSGSALINMHEHRHKIHSLKSILSYNTLDMIRNGTFAANTTNVDISNKTIVNTIFDHTEQAKVLGHEFISKDYTINNTPIYEHSNSKYRLINQNNYAFDNVKNNLNTIEPNGLMAYHSYLNKLESFKYEISVDPIFNINSGDCVDLLIEQNIPSLKGTDEHDEVNSGKYLISAIKHNFGGGEYKMTIELIRDSIGISHGANK